MLFRPRVLSSESWQVIIVFAILAKKMFGFFGSVKKFLLPATYYITNFDLNYLNISEGKPSKQTIKYFQVLALLQVTKYHILSVSSEKEQPTVFARHEKVLVR